jgi:hypothetical protein
MPKLTLNNGLWIGIASTVLQKLTMVEETLIARYHCHTILVKLRYTNKGSTIGQHAPKGNIVNFAQDLKSAIKFLNILPSSFKSLNDTIIMHFVESSHLPIELVKSYKLLYVRK